MKQSRPSTLTLKGPSHQPPYPFTLSLLLFALYLLFFIRFYIFHTIFLFSQNTFTVVFLLFDLCQLSFSYLIPSKEHFLLLVESVLDITYLKLSIYLERKNMLYEARYNDNDAGSGDSLLSDYFASPRGGDGLRVALDKVMFFFVIFIGHTSLNYISNPQFTV